MSLTGALSFRNEHSNPKPSGKCRLSREKTMSSYDFISMTGDRSQMREVRNELIPTIIRQGKQGEYQTDLFSGMLEDGLIDLTGPIDSMVSTRIKYALDHCVSRRISNVRIELDSPGGSVTAGMTIVDRMEYLTANGHPIGVVISGLAASMGLVIACSGAPGLRWGYPNSRYMMHQPLIPETGGKATEIRATADEMDKTYWQLATQIAKHTGQPVQKVYDDMHEDRWFDAVEAQQYGLIDFIIGVDV